MTQHESTRLTTLSEDSAGHSGDLSVYLARHHAALVVLAGPRRGSELPLHRPRVVIGRAMEADLVFQDDTVSREHAAISFRGGCFVVEDLGSSNGTWVNGENVAVHSLRHGDRIKLGHLELQVLIEVREPTPRTHVLEVEPD